MLSAKAARRKLRWNGAARQPIVPGWTMPGWTTPGWTMPGDVGYLDDDDTLFLTDRKARDDHFGGREHLPPGGREPAHHHPKVADMAVIGMPDTDMGEGQTKRITG